MNVLQECRCTNRIGYEVQHLTPQGWKACSMIFSTELEAELHMRRFRSKKTEFRVYDALEMKNEK
jgi:hypothetical protein